MFKEEYDKIKIKEYIQMMDAAKQSGVAPDTRQSKVSEKLFTGT